MINSEPPEGNNADRDFSPKSVWEPDSDDEVEESGGGLRKFFRSKVSTANLLSKASTPAPALAPAPEPSENNAQVPPPSSGSDGSKGSASSVRTAKTSASIPSAFGSFGGAIGGSSAIGLGTTQELSESSLTNSPSLFARFRARKKTVGECSDSEAGSSGVSRLMQTGLPDSPKRVSILASETSSIRRLIDMGEDNGMQILYSIMHE